MNNAGNDFDVGDMIELTTLAVESTESHSDHLSRAISGTLQAGAGDTVTSG